MTTEKSHPAISKFDPEMAALIEKEQERQRLTLNLIASENFASPLVTDLEGCIFTNKNVEGYPNQRLVAGCEVADRVENLAIERLKQIFNCEHANVQSSTATVANISVMQALLNPGDTILSMNLNHGGHLSHGAGFHYSGKQYKAIHYGVDANSEIIDLEEVSRLANEHRPKLIICGGSSYPRLIDWAGFSAIAKSINAYLLADIAHNVGFIAANIIPSPVPFADVVTTSTHKTWRGPRGCGIILCRKELASKIDRAVFPGIQGAPKFDMIAARAVLFKESMTKEFKTYAIQTLSNAKALTEVFKEQGIRMVTDGTDTHLILLDIRKHIPSGKLAEDVLASVGLITNKNMIPFDSASPKLSSGIRLGSPFLTTRGMKEKEMHLVGNMVTRVLKNHDNPKILQQIKEQVIDLASKYPLFADEWLPQEVGQCVQ